MKTVKQKIRGEVRAFPKVFAIGTDYIAGIFDNEVEVTEKIDGSQFVFGNINGETHMRSKGKVQYAGAIDGLFKEAADYVLDLELPENIVFYCEYLRTPKHNVLAYGKTPKNHLALFGVSTIGGTFESSYNRLKEYAELLEIDVVPQLYSGVIKNIEMFNDLLENTSYLGKINIEGVVVKNYKKPFLLGGQPIGVMAGKYVSEKFKETHREKWGRNFTSKGKFQVFKESFRTEARWQKAVQHLQEKGKLESKPRDIGALIKEIQIDIRNEEKENIKEFLWKEFGSDITRYATRGFPEWYKQKLLERGFNRD